MIPQAELAKLTGLDRSLISLYECGLHELGDSAIVALKIGLLAAIARRAKLYSELAKSPMFENVWRSEK